MSPLGPEWRKCRRTGALSVLPAGGLAGGVLAVASLRLGGDTSGPAGALLARCWGMTSVINSFALVLAACMFWHTEFEGQAIRKMALLPVSLPGLYLCKLLPAAAGLLAAVGTECLALLLFGSPPLPPGELFSFGGYACLCALPVLTVMWLAASRQANMWVPLGLGAAGFLSAMALTGAGRAALLHPFVLMLRPVLAPEGARLLPCCLAGAESLLFLLWGLLAARRPVI